MMCFAAITPHTPLLIPTIGKENLKKLETTRLALGRLAEEIYAAQPDTIVVISSHSIQHEDAFSINLHDEYLMDFKDFGDLATTRRFAPDVEFITQVQRHMEGLGIPFTLDSNASLDYGTGVPLYCLTEQLPNVRIVPLSYCGLSFKKHLQFGSALKDVIESSHQRIAIIASGDLSHCLSSESPLGFKPDGEAYDQKILEAVRGVSTAILLAPPIEWIRNANACIHEQLLILFGALEKKNVRAEILSYESPFGVGYLVAQFHL